MQHAIRKNDLEAVQIFIDRGGNVNATNFDGETALMRAASVGSEQITEMLLQNGADISACDDNGKTALDIALSHRYKKVAEILEVAKTAKNHQ